MTHLINNMTNYFMFEVRSLTSSPSLPPPSLSSPPVQVIETAYRRLEEGIVEAVCLDDVIKVHDTYLNEIFLRALQSEQHENLNTQVCCAFLPDLDPPPCLYPNQIHHVIQAILRFCNLEEALISGPSTSPPS
jgi:hypothetical protein